MTHYINYDFVTLSEDVTVQDNNIKSSIVKQFICFLMIPQLNVWIIRIMLGRCQALFLQFCFTVADRFLLLNFSPGELRGQSSFVALWPHAWNSGLPLSKSSDKVWPPYPLCARAVFYPFLCWSLIDQFWKPVKLVCFFSAFEVNWCLRSYTDFMLVIKLHQLL